ncbi:MAG TPA: nuclear transport factor 2 family protein [Polyangia bacterium]|nr:nuclear transport factor 2 family protein [Polyangia bacterium]
MRTTFLALALMFAVPAAAAPRSGDAALEAYPELQAQVRRRLDEIWATIAAKDVAKLESFHLYGPKFTSFKDGQSRGDGDANKKGEKEFIAVLTDSKVEMKDLAIAVYGDTAIATFNGDFSGKIDGHPITAKQAATLVFLKYKGDWKIVHEHFSPLGPPPQGK